MKQEFILTLVGAKFQVGRMPIAGVLGNVLIKFQISGPGEPTLPSEPQTINELLVWAAELVKVGYEFDR
jgi:hypothetical protein